MPETVSARGAAVSPSQGCAAWRTTPHLWFVVLALAVAVGAILRLVWVADMEYKRDEAWLFERAVNSRNEPIPWIGIQSSMLLLQPGMSVWVFIGLARVFGAEHPTLLAQSVQLLNIGAILLVAIFALCAVPKEEREPWLWGAALGSLNPMAVVFHRKIWQPSTLSFFTVLTLAAWWFRARWWGAFLWGVLGACLGQIHLSGFFLMAGFAAWALLFDRKSVAWKAWLLGSFMGMLPAIPWMLYLLRTYDTVPETAFVSNRLSDLTFWNFWIRELFGLGLRFSLGPHFQEFLTYPVVGGKPTNLVWALHGLSLALAGIIFGSALVRILRERPRLVDLFVGRGSPTVFTLNAAFFGFGILLTASGMVIHRHYMVVTFPLEFVWISWIALRTSVTKAETVEWGRRLLLACCVVQFLLTASFLSYIHTHGGAPGGDYGVAYRAQPQPNLPLAEEVDKVERLRLDAVLK